jgi:predicted enzyme related to lactoylglutathione lyase
MNLKCEHIGFNVADLKSMKEFYVDKLGLELLDEKGNFFAVRAGDVRFSFFGGSVKYPVKDDSTGMSVILRTDNIKETRDMIVNNGIKLVMDITEAPGFMRFISFEDPENNAVHIGEYLADPLKKLV